MRYLTALIFSLFACAQAWAIDPAPAFPTSASLNAQYPQGTVGAIATGTNLRMINFNQNYGSWYHEVLKVDANNNVLSPTPMRVSQSYLYDQMARTINSNLEFIDRETGKTVKGYPGQRYVVTGARNKGWKTYDVHFVDSEGTGVDHKGIPTTDPRHYRVSQRYLDADRLHSPLVNYAVVQGAAANAGNPPNEGCPPSSPQAPTTSLRPEPRPDDLVTTPPAGDAGSSYAYLTANRTSLRAKGVNSCLAKKEKIQNGYLEKHPFARLNISERADKILSDAKSVINSMKSASGAKNSRNTNQRRASSGRYKDFVNGHYIDPVVTPEVSACISYQETKGNLNPYAVNYTLCNSKMTSTAHGLGQITRSTMKGLVNNPDGELLPLNTRNSSKYKGMSIKEVHSKMSGDVGMQLEVLMRILSSNAKFIRWKSPGLSEDEVLRRAIIQYDRDSQSKYIRNVFNNCLPCMRNGGSGSKCYQTVK